MHPQQWRPGAYNSHAAFVSNFGTSVVDLLQVRHGERILDLGCGEGTLAEKLKALGAEVVGVDSSPSMVEAMRARGLTANVMSGDSLTYTSEFDAVFSNAALHWMQNYHGVIGGVFTALKPGGRFVGEFGAAGNIRCIVDAIQDVMSRNPEFGAFKNPWFFPTAEAYTDALKAGGFAVEYAEAFPRPTPLATGIREWLKVFADHVISGLHSTHVERFLGEVESQVRPSLYTVDSGWVADYVRLRFVATKPTTSS